MKSTQRTNAPTSQPQERTRTPRRRRTVTRLPTLITAAVLLLAVAAAALSDAAVDPAPTVIGTKLVPDDAHEPGVFGLPSHYRVLFGSSVAMDGDTLVVGTAFDPGHKLDWVYVFEREPGGPWVQAAKLDASDAEAQRFSGFGRSVAVDEEAGVIVVGDPGYDVPGEENAGAVYVFERDGQGTWNEVAMFAGPNPPGVNHRPRLGWSVDVDGGTVVAGAPRVPGGPNPDVEGVVHVFERGPDGWTRAAVLGPSPDPAHDKLGYAVSLSGDTLAAGAPGGLAETGEYLGSVALFEATAGAWELARTLQPTLQSPAGSPNVIYGFDLDLEGDTLIVGDPGWGSTPGWGIWPPPLAGEKYSTLTGTAYVHDRAGGTWSLSGTLLPPSPHPFMAFGTSVRVNEAGTLAVVGAYGAIQAPFGLSPPAGGAYVFARTPGGPWALQAELTGPDTSPGDQFGSWVTISGTTVAAGAPFDDNRRDGVPFPFDDQGRIEPEACQALGCQRPTDGKDAGSVYTFEVQGPLVGGAGV